MAVTWNDLPNILYKISNYKHYIVDESAKKGLEQ